MGRKYIEGFHSLYLVTIDGNLLCQIKMYQKSNIPKHMSLVDFEYQIYRFLKGSSPYIDILYMLYIIILYILYMYKFSNIPCLMILYSYKITLKVYGIFEGI